MPVNDDLSPDDEFDGESFAERWAAMDADERHAFARAELIKWRRRRAEMIARGPEAEYLLAELDRKLQPLETAVAELEKTRQEKERVMEQFLQCGADVADTRAESYTKFNSYVQWLALEFPGNPQVAELKKIFDSFAKEIPAELVQPPMTRAELEARLREQGFMEPPPA